MKDYPRNEHKNHKKCNIVPSCRIVLALLLLFWLSNHIEYIGRALYNGFINVLNKPLLVFVFMNFIIFTLCFIPSQKQIQPTPYDVVYHEGSNRGNSDVKNPLSDDDEEEETILEDKHIILVENTRESFDVWNDHYYYDDHHELELRRLERGMIKEMVITMGKPPWTSSSMDDMSNEEFRFAIEAFISQRNKAMMQENFHDEEAMHLLISM